MTTTNKTIVFFHTGRGGSFHNSGHVSFCGTKTIGEVLSINDSGKNNSFLNKKNQVKIYNLLKKRNLENLMELFEKCSDRSDFSRFEKITGLELGEDVYTDCNGTQIITVAEVETGVGTLNWDYDYDTDTCMLLSDCSQGDLELILESKEYNNESLIQEYFDNNTDLKVDWKKFNGEYGNLIEGYFNDISFDINEFYEEEE